LNEPLDQYGVIGHPVAHSWSPFIHGQFARQTGQAIAYRLHDVPSERFREHVLDFAAAGGRGLNVTIPHKLAAAALATELSERARRAGAVNTLKFDGGRLFGDNTDGAGLVRDLGANLELPLAGRRILIVGAGGAARGVIAPLLELRPRELVIAARAGEKARALAADFSGSAVRLSGCALAALPRGPFDLLINATSASLIGEVPEVADEAVGPTTTCYDMAYSPARTPFERWALEHGCERAVQGWGMLVEQAAESFELWRGVRPDTAPVLGLLVSGRASRASSAS
jgi:shikimate dehydrogenase